MSDQPDGTAVAEARWERLTTTTAAADGTVSTAGAPVTALGWLAVRAAE